MIATTTALRWIPAGLHAALLFLLSAQPELKLADEPALDLVVRKVGHFGAYAALAVLVAYALDGLEGTPQGRGRRARRTRMTLLIVVAYAVSDEVHQAFVPGRSPAVADVAIDSAGGLAGLALVRLLDSGRLRLGASSR